LHRGELGRRGKKRVRGEKGGERRLRTSSNVVRNVGIGEEGEGVVDLGEYGGDLEELSFAVLDVLARNARGLEELSAAREKAMSVMFEGRTSRIENAPWMLVEHLLDERTQRLESLTSVDELLAADGCRPSVAVKGDAEVIAEDEEEGKRLKEEKVEKEDGEEEKLQTHPK
jgi:hypothetical protein